MARKRGSVAQLPEKIVPAAPDRAVGFERHAVPAAGGYRKRPAETRDRDRAMVIHPRSVAQLSITVIVPGSPYDSAPFRRCGHAEDRCCPDAHGRRGICIPFHGGFLIPWASSR